MSRLRSIENCDNGFIFRQTHMYLEIGNVLLNTTSRYSVSGKHAEFDGVLELICNRGYLLMVTHV